jgi:beta-glucosidase
VANDARWGRVMEGAGEDPYLGSKIAIARVKGFQGETIADLAKVNTIAACAKHFAAYGYVEAGLEYNIVDISNSNCIIRFCLLLKRQCRLEFVRL